jgi:hypothetical protein
MAYCVKPVSIVPFETFSTLLRCDLSAVSGFARDDVEVMTERVTQTHAFDNESACA